MTLSAGSSQWTLMTSVGTIACPTTAGERMRASLLLCSYSVHAVVLRPHYNPPLSSSTSINNDTSVTMGLANNTAAAQQQNRYAQSAGINYWAFCIYPLQCKDYHPPDSDCPEIQCCAGRGVSCWGSPHSLAPILSHAVPSPHQTTMR